jgi:hypothetical protein
MGGRHEGGHDEREKWPIPGILFQKYLSIKYLDIEIYGTYLDIKITRRLS